MVRSPCRVKEENNNLKKGPWTPEEDERLMDCIKEHGHGSWRRLPKLAGLNRCGKSCRLRWINYLRPDIKRGKFSEDEERTMVNLHAVLGNKWSKIANHLSGRTDNEIKNYWNTHMRKKLLGMGIDPNTHRPRTDLNHLIGLLRLLSGSVRSGDNFVGNTHITSSPWDNILRLQNVLQATNPLLNRGGIIPETGSGFQVPFGNSWFNQNQAGTQTTRSWDGLDVNQIAGLVSGSSRVNLDHKGLVTNLQTGGSWDALVGNQLPGLVPDTQDDSQGKIRSKTELVNHLVSCPQDNSNMKQDTMTGNTIGSVNPIQTSGSWDAYEENQLMGLVPVTRDDFNADQKLIIGNGNGMINGYNDVPNLVSGSCVSSEPDMFETWEKLFDDNTSDSCWKSFLDLTASNSQSRE